MYCLEKDISCRSGRPSVRIPTRKVASSILMFFQAIEDDEITCRMPTSCPPGSSVNLHYLRVFVRLCQLYSVVDKRLSSARLSRQTSEELVRNVQELVERLDSLQQSFRAELGLELPLDLAKLPDYFNIKQALSIQFTYYNLLWEIHTPLLHPWYRGTPNLKQHPEYRSQIKSSTSVVASTSRAAILDSKYIQIGVDCPLLYVKAELARSTSMQAITLTSRLRIGEYVQMYANTNLFIAILTEPNSESAKSDLPLLDVGAGFFARLDIDTQSVVSMSYARDLAKIARKAVRDADSLGNQENGPPIFSNEQDDLLPTSFQAPDMMTAQINIDDQDEVRCFSTPVNHNSTTN